MADPVALIALALDAAFGWPERLYRRIGHPVGAIAAIIGALEKTLNRPSWPDATRRIAGIATLAITLAVTGGIAWGATWLLTTYLGAYAWIGIGLLAAPGLAQRSLNDHVAPIAAALGKGDVQGARIAVGKIVGRDTDRLDSAGIARAGIESLAESFCDGIVAPLFWLLVGGLPGLWIYKAINTADSLIGHREPRWRAFGWASARIDDLANWIPARISGALLCLAGPGGWHVMRRDARKHASPNAGWPEAAMAGVLDLRLAGPVSYDGVTQLKPWIGSGRPAATAADIARALQVYRRACLLLWIVTGVLLWVR
ncbi:MULTISPECIES: adenosylcobinamide-phosphate synthase CbiB [unclassified Sphingomonas]|uniref:adenosylcobinamide-phosphate synthase CbiB n=1 Tax=Sphingomonas sp. PvP015 TaxID=3156388 RepID=UPI003396E5AF